MSSYEKGKHSKKSILIFKILSIIFCILLLICVSYLSWNYIESRKNKMIYENSETEIEKVNDNTNLKEQQEQIPENVQKVKNFKNENEDIKGWIQIEDTIIDYPILQTTDNDYYLKHNYKKEKSKYGSIYLNKKSDILNEFSNVIIYGHNMKDDQMFNTLLKYENKEFYDEHTTIKIATENGENEYSIICVFKSRIFYQDEENVFRYYNYTKFENEENYNEYIQNCKKIQLYETGVPAKYGEQLITLITCEYSQENGRMVVVAKKES